MLFIYLFILAVHDHQYIVHSYYNANYNINPELNA